MIVATSSASPVDFAGKTISQGTNMLPDLDLSMMGPCLRPFKISDRDKKQWKI
jgi:hypothetical protein